MATKAAGGGTPSSVVSKTSLYCPFGGKIIFSMSWCRRNKLNSGAVTVLFPTGCLRGVNVPSLGCFQIDSMLCASDHRKGSNQRNHRKCRPFISDPASGLPRHPCGRSCRDRLAWIARTASTGRVWARCAEAFSEVSSAKGARHGKSRSFQSSAMIPSRSSTDGLPPMATSKLPLPAAFLMRPP